jgi:hypothetical protein
VRVVLAAVSVVSDPSGPIVLVVWMVLRFGSRPEMPVRYLLNRTSPVVHAPAASARSENQLRLEHVSAMRQDAYIVKGRDTVDDCSDRS